MMAILFERKRTLHLFSTKENAPRRWLIQPSQQTRYRRFAAPTLSHQRQRAARIERERCVLNGMNDIFGAKELDSAQREVLAQMCRLQDRRDTLLFVCCRIERVWEIGSSV